jgi:carbon monoxide dehydrogenase subunit G
MILKDSFTVDAPIEEVWDFFQDIPRLSACIPGIEEVEEIEPDVFRGVMKVKVGPLSARFSGQVKVLERVAPERLVALVEGEDSSSASSAKATFTGVLIEEGNGTRLEYETDVSMRGRLAQFGFAVIRGTAKKMTGIFANNLQEALNP